MSKYLRFTGAYRILKNIPITSQDKAIEIVNMPYKDYKDYKDWSDNVIIDGEDVDTAKLRTFIDPLSHKTFYESLMKHSKLNSHHSTEFFARLYGEINFSNFLTISKVASHPKIFVNNQEISKAERKNSGIHQITEKEASNRESTDQNKYVSRAILNRRIRLIDVKKYKSEFKLLKRHKEAQNLSYLVGAFSTLR